MTTLISFSVLHFFFLTPASSCPPSTSACRPPQSSLHPFVRARGQGRARARVATTARQSVALSDVGRPSVRPLPSVRHSLPIPHIEELFSSDIVSRSRRVKKVLVVVKLPALPRARFPPSGKRRPRPPACLFIRLVVPPEVGRRVAVRREHLRRIL